MSIQNLHRIDKVVMPGADFSIITNRRHNFGIESMIERPAGHAHPMFSATTRQRPMIEFSTPQIGTAVNAIPVCGAALANVAAYLKKATQTGSVARATTQHKRSSIASAMVYWTSITLPHNGKGEIQIVVCANYDGVNAPIAFTGGVALPGNLTCDEFFGSGPTRINGSFLHAVQDISIQSGVQLVQEGDSSEVFDTFTGLEITEPSITINTKHAFNWETLGLAGAKLDGASGFECWGRRYANGESRVPDGTASHIYFQALNGRCIPVDSNGESNSPITDSLKIEPVSGDDSVLPFLCFPGVTM